MAGQPKLRALCAQIEREGGDDVIFDQVVIGKSRREIMEQYGVSMWMFMPWVRAGGEERKARLKEAEQLLAHALVAEGQAILDDPAFVATSAEVSLRTQRANWRKWRAEKLNREEFGDAPPSVNVNVSLGDLHLDALLKRGYVAAPVQAAALADPTIQDAEYEVDEPYVPAPPAVEGDDLLADLMED